MNIPESKFPFYHKLKVQMRFNDIDVFGHVNNTMYFQYMDLGKTEYIGETLGDEFDPHNDALVIANINCQFYNPAFYNEPLEVLTRTVSLGEHSLTLEQRVVNAHTGSVKCICVSVMVGFNARTSSSIVIPEKWKDAIRFFEKREF